MKKNEELEDLKDSEMLSGVGILSDFIVGLITLTLGIAGIIMAIMDKEGVWFRVAGAIAAILVILLSGCLIKISWEDFKKL